MAYLLSSRALDVALFQSRSLNKLVIFCLLNSYRYFSTLVTRMFMGVQVTNNEICGDILGPQDAVGMFILCALCAIPKKDNADMVYFDSHG